MRRGRRSKPIISKASIETALKTFGFTSREAPEAATLESLALIDMRLVDAARPSAENLRGWTLRRILAEMIENNLNENRQFFDLSKVHENQPRKAATVAMQEDGQSPSIQLKAWSSLYYRYVRSELGFTVEELAESLNITSRQFQRYQEEGLSLLRDTLIIEEWQARQRLLKQYLRRSIPSNLTPLIGREEAFQVAIATLSKEFPRPIYITGMAGIGKTALAAQIANSLIESNLLDFLVWLTKPQDISAIYNTLLDNLTPYPSRHDWKALMGDAKLLLVLDGLDNLPNNQPEWENLLADFASVRLILISRDYLPLNSHALHLPLPELSLVESKQLIANYTALDSLDEFPITKLGGNPRLLEFAAQEWQVIRDSNLKFSAFSNLYDELFSSLTKTEVLTCICLALECNIESLIADHILSNLIKKGLVKGQENTLKLISSAKHYMVDRFRQDNALQDEFERWLTLQPQQALESNAWLVLLSTEWLVLGDELRLALLTSCEISQLPMQDLRRFKDAADLLENEPNAALKLSYASCLRRLGEHKEAWEALEKLIQWAGLEGDFETQTLARYEMALILQNQARFEDALGIYAEISRYLRNRPNEILYQQLILQEARIAIEQQNGLLALKCLAERSVNHRQAEELILEAEAALLLRQWERSRHAAQAVLAVVHDKPILRASVHTILGRINQANAEYLKAIDPLNAALAIAEQYSSDFDIARAKTNLASVYLQTNSDLDEAEALLNQAKVSQERIHDAIGLFSTESNLQQLQILHLQ